MQMVVALHAVSEVVAAVALMAVALRFPWPVVAVLARHRGRVQSLVAGAETSPT